jgi:uncharacterized protein
MNIMKKFSTAFSAIIITAVFFAVLLYAQKLPSPVGYVNDFAGVLDPGSKNQMERLIGAVKETTGAEIAVVTVDTIDPYATVEEYSIDLATEWGIGKKGQDTGVLLVLAMKERQIRLEIGYGLEGAIPDGLAGEIIDKSIYPSLRAGSYGPGLLKGVQAVSGIIAKEYNVELRDLNVSESRKYIRSPLSGLSRLIFIVILMLLFGGGRLFLWPLLFMGAASRRGFYGGGFGSRGSSFGGGGGFSGFGGGGFGGGGASRGF